MIFNKKILVVGAHFDDIEMGCGGTIAKLSKKNEITAIVVCDSEIRSEKKILRSKGIAKKEGFEALKILGVKKIITLSIKTNEIEKKRDLIYSRLAKINDINNFDYIFSHWFGDAHRDHRELSKICLSIFRKIDNFLMYESNYYFGEKKMTKNFFFDISDVSNTKIAAIKHHKSEMIRNNNKWLKYFQNDFNSNGLMFDKKACEGFYLLKYLQN